MFIDPRTMEKIVILSGSETLPRLSEKIEPEHIPEQFGGKFKYELGMLPSLDSGMQKQMEWIGEPREVLPAGPLKWTLKDGKRTAVVTGSAKGERVHLPFAVLDAK